jgi:hypothetical protein
MRKTNKSKKPAERRRRRVIDNVADWGGANEGLLRSVVENVTKGGGAVRFGYSQDGGAYSLGIYGDGEPFTEYLPATADVDEWLEGFRLDYE